MIKLEKGKHYYLKLRDDLILGEFYGDILWTYEFKKLHEGIYTVDYVDGSVFTLLNLPYSFLYDTEMFEKIQEIDYIKSFREKEDMIEFNGMNIPRKLFKEPEKSVRLCVGDLLIIKIRSKEVVCLIGDFDFSNISTDDYENGKTYVIDDIHNARITAEYEILGCLKFDDFIKYVRGIIS